MRSLKTPQYKTSPAEHLAITFKIKVLLIDRDLWNWHIPALLMNLFELFYWCILDGNISSPVFAFSLFFVFHSICIVWKLTTVLIFIFLIIFILKLHTFLLLLQTYWNWWCLYTQKSLISRFKHICILLETCFQR